MKFVCMLRYSNGATARANFNANDEVDACWAAKDLADMQDAELINVWHARKPGHFGPSRSTL